MWQSFRNANPQVKAAIIGGIFLILAAIVTGAFGLIKLETGASSPTPTPIQTTIVSITQKPTDTPSPTPTDIPTPTPSPTLTTSSTPLKTLQTLCSAAKNADYQTQWNQFTSTFRANSWTNEQQYANDIMQRDSTYGGVKDCTVSNVTGNSGTTTTIFNDGSIDTNEFALVLESDGVWRINALLKHSGV